MSLRAANDRLESALDRLAHHLSSGAEAERRRRFEEGMAEMRAAREELGRIIGVGAKE